MSNVKIFDTSLLVEDKIAIKSNRSTAKYYRELGYDVPDQFSDDNMFEINPSDLPNKSSVKVRVRCCGCGVERVVVFSDRANRCNTCANILTVSKLDITGSNNPNYKPHITDEERRLRIEDKRDYRFRKWSYAVKELAEFKCDKCQTTKARFNSHHLNNYTEFKNERYDTENGVCLCVDCHKLFHSIYGLKTTKDQYIKFKETYNVT